MLCYSVFDEFNSTCFFLCLFFCFFFNDTATTEIYTLSLHDALPISGGLAGGGCRTGGSLSAPDGMSRSEEHTSELQSRPHLVCRLLLEKKTKQNSDLDFTRKDYKSRKMFIKHWNI